MVLSSASTYRVSRKRREV